MIGKAIAEAIYEKLGMVVSYGNGTSFNATVHCVIPGTLFGKIFDTITRQHVKIEGLEHNITQAHGQQELMKTENQKFCNAGVK